MDHLLDEDTRDEIEEIKAMRLAKDMRSRGVWTKGFKKSKNNDLVLIRDAFAIASKKNALKKLAREMEDIQQQVRRNAILGKNRRQSDGLSAPPEPPQPLPTPSLPQSRAPLPRPPTLPKPAKKKKQTLFSFGFSYSKYDSNKKD